MEDSIRKNQHGLTDKQQRYCDIWVARMSAGDVDFTRTDCAREAGYVGPSAAVTGSVLMQNPAVQEEIKRQTLNLFHEDVPLAQHVLRQLVKHGTPAVRRGVAERILAQCGMQPVEKTETTVTVVDTRTPEQKLARLQELAAEDPRIGKAVAHLLPAPPIEAEFEEIPIDTENLDQPEGGW